jgi:hypothetical protein
MSRGSYAYRGRAAAFNPMTIQSLPVTVATETIFYH